MSYNIQTEEGRKIVAGYARDNTAELQEIKEKISNLKETQLAELPEEDNKHDVVQYIGPTTDKYTFGHFYQYTLINEGTEDEKYAWVEINVMGITIEENSAEAAGIVAAGSGHENKVWSTDAEGNPAWNTLFTIMTDQQVKDCFNNASDTEEEEEIIFNEVVNPGLEGSGSYIDHS